MSKKTILNKVIPLALVLSLFGTFAPVFSAEKSENAEIIHATSISRSNSMLTIDDIDELMAERSEALLLEDFDRYHELTSTLNQMGVQSVTFEEVQELTNDNLPLMDNLDASTRAANFETVYSTYTTGGKSYDVMRIYATPTTSSSLYQTGVTAVKNSSSAAANVMECLKIVVTSTAGLKSNTIGTVQTVYDAFKSIITQIGATTTITSIDASYTWNTAETCAFIYFKSASGTWMQAGEFSQASSTVTVVVPSLNGTMTGAKSKTYTGSAVPINYNDIASAFNAFNSGGNVYRSKVSKVTITGIQGKTVKTVSLQNPNIPGVIN